MLLHKPIKAAQRRTKRLKNATKILNFIDKCLGRL